MQKNPKTKKQTKQNKQKAPNQTKTKPTKNLFSRFRTAFLDKKWSGFFKGKVFPNFPVSKTLLDQDLRLESPREYEALKKILLEMLFGFKASVLLTV